MVQVRTLHKLSARASASQTQPGRSADGGNLFLVIAKSGAKRWAFIFVRAGKQREMGLGAYSTTTLAQARQKAQECRAFLAVGQDPIEARKVAKSSASRHTFKQCVDGLIKAKRAEWRSSKHAAQYAATLNRSCYALHDRAIAEIDTAAVLAILQPMWARTPETALHLRGRIEAVLDYATAQGWRTGENPASRPIVLS